MKIAFLGTRGIPNNYGGFEQFAEFISVGLAEKGYDVTVYNPHFHSYNCNNFKGVKIIKIKSEEQKIGAMGNFLYDYNCLKDASQRNFDIIYEAGYATCSPFFYLLKGSRTKLLTNMDGIEWMRSKWGFFTKRLIKYLESLAVKRSHYIISDNPGIQQYYKKNFNKDSYLVPYGADLSLNPDKKDIEAFEVSAGEYFMLVARMEPENNIDLILKSYEKCKRKEPFLVIGNYKTRYGRYLYKKYNNSQIRFIGSIYDKKILDSLRFFCKAYLHGHSVGGTNPSLLEAMASSTFIIAHKNPFNASVLCSNALYFDTMENLSQHYENVDAQLSLYKTIFIKNNIEAIASNYSWQTIINQYENIFHDMVSGSR